ncbi:MAG: hypothetical protein OEY07_13885, partial [Gammaproteobacteria bacterium]|nr:hypothetical protein [Gammaproteobacteria bacterium]
SLSEELAGLQLQDAVLVCINRLSDKYRELMTLRYIEDLSVKEIVAVTGYSESDIKVTLLRARKQFDQGLTQHMYLKLAKSRQQCETMDHLLAPYAGRDIPQHELSPFEKHLAACRLCSEDAEEMKRTRQLLALVPFVAAPLSLDSVFNEAMAAHAISMTPDPATLANKSIFAKAAATVTAVAIIAGGGFYLWQQDANVVTPLKPVTAPPVTAQTPSVPAGEPAAAEQTTPAGSIPFSARAQLTAGTPVLKAQWAIYRLGDNDKEHLVTAQTTAELHTTLATGRYRIKTYVGDTQVARDITLTDQPVSLDVVLDAGELALSTDLPGTIRVHDSQLSYLFYKSEQDMAQHKLYLAKSFSGPTTRFVLPNGEYYIKAKYTGMGNIESVKKVTVTAGETTALNIPIEVGMFKPLTRLSGKDLRHIRNINWSMIKQDGRPNTTTSIMSIDNAHEIPMAPGNYLFTAQLGNIKQSTRFTIKHGQLTEHKLVLKGGIVRATAWTDHAHQQVNDKVYIDFFTHTTKQPGNQQKVQQVMSKQKAADVILPPGTYYVQAWYPKDWSNPVKTSRQITVRDGDNLSLDFIIPE